MDPAEAMVTMHVVDQGRTAVRRDLRDAGFPLVLFGGLSLASAVVVVLGGAGLLGWYWALAGPGGGVLIAAHSIRRDRRLGLRGPAAAYVLTAAILVAGCLAFGFVGAGVGLHQLAAAGPPIAVGVATMVFGKLERTPSLVAVGAVLVAVPVLLLLLGIDGETFVLVTSVTLGATYLSTGLVYLLEKRSTR